MKKRFISTGFVATSGITVGILGLFGAAGVASATPDVVGLTVGEAMNAIQDEGGWAKVAVTVGDRRSSMGECLVIGVTRAPFVRDVGGSFEHTDSEYHLTINCNRGVATSKVPGNSAAGPAGKAFQAKVDEAQEAADAEQNEEEELSEAGEVPES
jgi:hypothetical protein